MKATGGELDIRRMSELCKPTKQSLISKYFTPDMPTPLPKVHNQPSKIPNFKPHKNTKPLQAQLKQGKIERITTFFKPRGAQKAGISGLDQISRIKDKSNISPAPPPPDPGKPGSLVDKLPVSKVTLKRRNKFYQSS